jgi:L-cysteine desulfidase
LGDLCRPRSQWTMKDTDMQTDTLHFTAKDVLRTEVALALGCTEPVAIALSSAAAASLLPSKEIESIDIWVNPNIYKNAIAVSIPGADDLRGLDVAGALGAFGGDPFLRLEVLKPITAETAERAKLLTKENKVDVHIVTDQEGLFIRTLVRTKTDEAECVIKGLHDHITLLRLNGEPVSDSPLLSGEGDGRPGVDLQNVETWLRTLSLKNLIDLLDDLDADDLAFLEEGIQTNLRLAEHGLKFGSGLGIGRTLEKLVQKGLIQKDMVVAAKILTSAASDARMAGVSLPAMSSAGSGNHGLTATLPIWAVKDYLPCEHKRVIEAVGLSHFITAYVKAHTGRLSAVCGCSIAAGAGATAGITYMLGGNIHQMAGAIMNLTEDLAGVICDGAKAGCSFKLATAAESAVQAALFAIHGVVVQSTDGIIGLSPEQTMRNVAQLSTQGMMETDRTILKIMLDKKFHPVRSALPGSDLA